MFSLTEMWVPWEKTPGPIHLSVSQMSVMIGVKCRPQKVALTVYQSAVGHYSVISSSEPHDLSGPP